MNGSVVVRARHIAIRIPRRRDVRVGTVKDGERRRGHGKEGNGVLVCASEVPEECTEWTFAAIEEQGKVCHERSVVAVIDQQSPKVLVDDLIRLIERLR